MGRTRVAVVICAVVWQSLLGGVIALLANQNDRIVVSRDDDDRPLCVHGEEEVAGLDLAEAHRLMTAHVAATEGVAGVERVSGIGGKPDGKLVNMYDRHEEKGDDRGT